ncbi:MAG TPA: EAL domain-containing protein [Candidatus Acidoferrales bacterium]|nr:EAL domain-containing protein [Candidatus Acidoferrales bacterium]
MRDSIDALTTRREPSPTLRLDELRRLVARDVATPSLDLSEHEVLRAVVAELPVALTAVDEEANVVLWNPAAHRLLGWTEEEVLGHRLPTVSGAREREFERQLEISLTTGEGVHQVETLRQHRDGHAIPVLLSTAALWDNTGRVTGVLASYEDIRDRKRIESKLRRQAHHDELTGLYNRRGFLERLQKLLGQTQGETAIFSLDLDEFKAVNDSLGHSVGDQLLKAFARRLRAAVRPGDLVARVGGDEFVVVMTGISRAGLEATARRLFDQLGHRYMIGDQEVVTAVSGGVALCRGLSEAEYAVSRADVALYHAKHFSPGRYQVIDAKMHNSFTDRSELAGQLAQAADRGELRLHFQPLVAAGTGWMTGIEALVRWARPRRQLVYPDQFIVLAEQTGSITGIGRWVLQQACGSLRDWEDTVPAAKSLTVSVNLSVVQLRDPELPEEVRQILDQYQLEPDRLCLEVTESALSADPDAEVSVLNRLRDLGVHLAMDDFGTGNSSLTALRRFPFDILKIDRSFVSGIGTGEEDSAIVAATISLGRALGLKTVAEGVETEAQAAFLVRNGCDELQGYLFGRPVPFSDLTGPTPLLRLRVLD